MGLAAGAINNSMTTMKVRKIVYSWDRHQYVVCNSTGDVVLVTSCLAVVAKFLRESQARFAR